MKLKDYILQHYSKRTVSGYILLINHFIVYQGSKINKTTYNEVVEYIGMLRERRNNKTGECLHPKTLRNHLFCIKIYFRYLVAVGKRNDHPCESLYLKDQINRAILVESLYTKEALENLYKTFKSPKDNRPNHEKSEVTKKKDKIILSLLIYQALTTTEVVNLELNDINLEEGTIEIRGNESIGRRGNKSRILALKSKQILLFDNYIKKPRKELWRRQKPSKRQRYFILNEQGLQLYGSYLNRMLSKGREPQNIFTPLKIRQSVIANLLKGKNDLRIVQEFAGHRRAGSTEAYKRTGFEELKMSIEKLHPRQ